jgi:hypothetical protein
LKRKGQEDLEYEDDDDNALGRKGAEQTNRSAVRFGTWSRRKMAETSIAIEGYYIAEESRNRASSSGVVSHSTRLLTVLRE